MLYAIGNQVSICYDLMLRTFWKDSFLFPEGA
jgi:hypothetical protein